MAKTRLRFIKLAYNFRTFSGFIALGKSLSRIRQPEVDHLDTSFQNKVIAALRSKDSENRGGAICKIASLHKKEIPIYPYLKQIINLLNDHDEAVVLATIDLIGEITMKYQRTLLPLIYCAAQTSGDERFVANAVSAIGYMIENGARLDNFYSEWLVNLFHNESELVAKEAREALSKYVKQGWRIH